MPNNDQRKILQDFTEQYMEDHGHKLTAILLQRLGGTAEIAAEDITALENLFPGEQPAILTHFKNDRIVLTLMATSAATRKTQQ